MSKEAWDSFPSQEVVGKPFVLYEWPRNTEGVLARVEIENDYVQFYAVDAAVDAPRGVAGGAVEWISWLKDSDGEISVSIPLIGTLIISPA